MCIYTMSHQTVNENDFVSERTTQTLKDFTNSKINLLVMQRIMKISNKTSNPGRVNDFLLRYIQLQSHHQIQLGKLWFMSEMIFRKVFSQEIQILARKTVFWP